MSEIQAAYETQPLKLVEPREEEEEEADRKEQLFQNFGELKTAFSPLMQMLQSVSKSAHQHGPFTWLLNANHNALRGCTTCGQTWVGVMAGVSEADLQWHEVGEPESVDEEEKE